jgi:hypothetical protein
MTRNDAGHEWLSPVLKEIWQENIATRAALWNEVRGLTEAQLAFQSAPGRWSIGEILDHLCLAERSITRTISRILQHAAGLGQIGEAGTIDNPALKIDFDTYDRPALSPESVMPSPDRPLERLLVGLEESRDRLLEVTKRADGRVVGNVTLPHFQVGEINFYQWLTVEGAHEAKHLAQIRRLKADPAFPKA